MRSCCKLAVLNLETENVTSNNQAILEATIASPDACQRIGFVQAALHERFPSNACYLQTGIFDNAVGDKTVSKLAVFDGSIAKLRECNLGVIKGAFDECCTSKVLVIEVG